MLLLLLFVLAVTSKTGHFLSVTDFHLDVNYLPSSDPDTLCHRGKGKSKPYGHHLCDSPLILLADFFLSMQMKQVPQQVDFIISNGDFIRHNHDKNFIRTTKEALAEHNKSAAYLRIYFPNTPVVITMGNNDYNMSHTIFPELAEIYSDFLNSPPIEGVDHVTRFIDPRSPLAISPFNAFLNNNGYFVQRLTASLSVISLNTQDFYDSSGELYSYAYDAYKADKQLKWLEIVLQDLEDLGIRSGVTQTVYINGHVGPQVKLWFDPPLYKYYKIIRKYAQRIVAQFFGHNNLDYFRILYDRDVPQIPTLKKRNQIVLNELPFIPQSFFLFHPSVLPTFSPSYRIYSYNETHLVDYDQYTALLKDTNKNYRTDFRLTYRFSSTYNEDAITATSLDRIKSNFARSNRNYTKFLERAVAYREDYVGKPQLDVWDHVKKLFCGTDRVCP